MNRALHIATSLHDSVRITRASVLIVVLWATLGLVSVALLFGHSMTMTYRGADNDIAGRQAAQAIDGAVRYVETLLTDAESPGLLPDPADYLNDSVPVGEATFYLIGRSDEVSDGTVRAFGLVDESAKLSLNMNPNAQNPTAALSALAASLKLLPGVTEDFIDAIVDWQDPDDDVSGNGAESDTYLQFTPAYACKNGPFESVDELALLSGATREVLYGEDTNLNGVLDANENDGDESEPSDNADGRLDAGILEYVTVFNRESNKQSDGTTTRIDIRNLTQNAAALATLIDEKLGTGRAQRIIQAASAGGPLTSPLDFYVRCKTASALTEEEFGQLAYEISMEAGEHLYGLVNVNTASETVLTCIPGIGTDKAADLVAARLNREQTDTNYAWVVAVLTESVAVTAGPFITGRSSQVTADVAAVGRHGRGYRREKIVIDQSTGTPRVVYRRNLAPLGWALGTEIREELAQFKQEATR